MILDRVKSLLSPKVSHEAKVSGISLFLGKTLDQFGNRIESLESRQLQRGEKGDKGDPGKNGRDGIDGRNGLNGKDGRNGTNGKDGRDGEDGKDGVSVVDADIDFDRHLRITLSTGKIVDAGEIPVEKGLASVHVAGNAWQITVATTPPDNPQLNQLWLDIS